MFCSSGCKSEQLAYYFCKKHGAHKEIQLMSNNTIVKVKVEQLSKFGYKDSEGFVSYSKNLTDHDKALVVPGAEFEAELYTAPSGARYLNKIVARAPHVQVSKPVANENGNPGEQSESKPDTARAKRFTPKFEKKADNSMSKEEWAAKDQRISRQGVIQAAVIALAPVVSLEQLPEEAIKLATEMLKFVNPS